MRFLILNLCLLIDSIYIQFLLCNCEVVAHLHFSVFPAVSDVIVHIRYVWVRKTSLVLGGLCFTVLVLRRGSNHGDGGRGGGSGGRAGGKMQQQATLGAIDVQ